jgi:lipoprotein NlpD
MKNNRTLAKPGLFVVLATLLVLAGCASNSPAPVLGREGQPASVPVAPVARDIYTVKSGDTLYSIAREHGMDFRELIAMNGIDNPNRITPGKVLKVRPPAAETSAVATTAPVRSDVVLARPIGSEQVVEKRPLGSNTETLKREPKAGKEPYSEQALALAQNQIPPKASEPAVPVARTEATPDAKPEARPAEAPALTGDEIAWIWPASGKTVATFSEGGSKGVDIDGRAGDPVIAAGDGKVVYSGTGLRGYGKLVILKHNNTYLSAYAHNQTILVKEGQSVTKGQKIAEMGNTDADQVKLHFEVRRQGKPVDPLKYLPAR